jgi:prepilin-type N-terminal cleavage/methylation domain-containing protein
LFFLPLIFISHDLTMKQTKHSLSFYFTRNHSGVSLLEVVLAIMLIGVFATVGNRAVTSMEDARRFQYTLNAMETIRLKIIGNPAVIQSGMRADFGYWAYGAGAPAALSALDYRYWVTPDPYVTTTDAWGNAYSYEDGAGDDNLDVTSRGADGNPGGTGFATDLDMDIDLVDFKNNDVRVYCVDRLGHALLNDSTGGQDMIDSVAIVINGVSNACSYDSEGFWSDTNLSAGPCLIRVTPNVTWQTQLIGDNATTYLQMPAVIYPKANFAENEISIFEVRFPGEAITELT